MKQLNILSQDGILMAYGRVVSSKIKVATQTNQTEEMIGKWVLTYL
jgi:hypothetical protein